MVPLTSVETDEVKGNRGYQQLSGMPPPTLTLTDIHTKDHPTSTRTKQNHMKTSIYNIAACGKWSERKRLGGARAAGSEGLWNGSGMTTTNAAEAAPLVKTSSARQECTKLLPQLGAEADTSSAEENQNSQINCAKRMAQNSKVHGHLPQMN